MAYKLLPVGKAAENTAQETPPEIKKSGERLRYYSICWCYVEVTVLVPITDTLSL
jgi:hypothetical protein